jgi:hypothetical protein
VSNYGQKELRCNPFGQQRSSNSLLNREATQGGWQPRHVHAKVTDLYTEALTSGSYSSVGKGRFLEPFVHLSTVPIGFCYGGFSSTAGYVPGNEVQLTLDDFRYFGADQFPKRNPFLSGRYSKPFGFGARRLV